MIFNTLGAIQIDELSDLPIPEELLEQAKASPSNLWFTTGLPVDGAVYSLTRKTLYFQETPDGETKIAKDDFTGEAYIGGYILGGPDKDVHEFLSFKAKFFDGELKTISIDQRVVRSKAEYNFELNKARVLQENIAAREASWWFRSLYVPYSKIVMFCAHVVSWVTGAILQIMKVILGCLLPW